MEQDKTSSLKRCRCSLMQKKVRRPAIRGPKLVFVTVMTHLNYHVLSSIALPCRTSSGFPAVEAPLNILQVETRKADCWDGPQPCPAGLGMALPQCGLAFYALARREGDETREPHLLSDYPDADALLVSGHRTYDGSICKPQSSSRHEPPCSRRKKCIAP